MKRVLIVDDDRNLRRLYKTELEAEGYETILAANGREAVEMLALKVPDVIVMDARMPIMDGLEAMACILAKNRKIPIILNTAYSSYLDNYLTWAADACLIKCSDLQPLKNKIREVIGSDSSA
jgi:two-component system, response regulator, stage 0 sporulation protein F